MNPPFSCYSHSCKWSTQTHLTDCICLTNGNLLEFRPSALQNVKTFCLSSHDFPALPCHQSNVPQIKCHLQTFSMALGLQSDACLFILMYFSSMAHTLVLLADLTFYVLFPSFGYTCSSRQSSRPKLSVLQNSRH